MKAHSKIAKFLKGTGSALTQLSVEILEKGCFDKEDQELVSKIGANLLFHSKTYSFLELENKK